MSSKRAIRRKKCAGKIRHSTLAEAKTAALRMRKLHGGRFSAYGCGFCGAFHTGHAPARIRRAIETRA